jgi:hypothetical protein
MVSESAATVRRLLATSILHYSPVYKELVSTRNGCQGVFTLSGRLLSGKAVSTNILVSTANGKPQMKAPVASGSY